MPDDNEAQQKNPEWVTITVMFHTANISFTVRGEASRAQWHLMETFDWFVKRMATLKSTPTHKPTV